MTLKLTILFYVKVFKEITIEVLIPVYLRLVYIFNRRQ